MQRKPRRGLVVGLSVAAVVVLIAVGAAVAVPFFLSEANPAEITIAEPESRPEAEAWSLAGPGGAPDGADAWVRSGASISQGNALVIWDVVDDRGQETTWLSSVNTANGEESWSTQLDADVSGVTLANDPAGQTHALLTATTHDSSTKLIVLDVASGEAQPAGGLDLIAAPSLLGGDFIALDASNNEIGRYRPSSLQPDWTVEADGNSSGAVGGSSLVLGERAFSLEDGSERQWSPEPEGGYWELGGALMSSRIQGDGYLIGAVNEADGTNLWTMETTTPPYRILSIPGTALIALPSDGDQATAILNPADGEVLWRTSALTPDGYFAYGSEAAGVVILQVGPDRSTATVFDLESGAQLFDLSVSESGDYWRSAIGVTSRTIFLAGGRNGELQAVDTSNGNVRWTLDNPFSNWYGFDAWGGNLVAFHGCCSGPTDSDGAFHAPLLGIR
ncbi:outer membrane protein assembly factor BamB family protein [Microbacterium aurum]